MKDLIRKIKEKKELSGLADSFVSQALDKVLKKHSTPRSPKEEKLIIKETRAMLRKSAGRFLDSNLIENKDQSILEAHSSTRERLAIYPELKKKIYSLNPKSILDIGCGLNPLAIAKKHVKYIATDINENYLKIVSNFFKKEKIEGDTMILDVKTSSSFPKADLCLMLKLVDVIEEKGHKRTEEIIKSLNCKDIIISFSTKTLSGKPMNHPQRGWIEQLCNRLNLKFSIWSTPNEIFYFIKKS
ncbi:MAG: hypothetical protein AABW79_00245 [Nanoarchaeota archaeon]